MKNRKDAVWQSTTVVDRYLEGVRGALPLALEQIKVMVRVITTRQTPIERFLDLGCGDGILARALLEKYPTAQGILFDFSEPMIEAAQKKLSDFSTNHSQQ